MFLSEPDSPSQWENYANEKSGIAIGFAREPLTKVCNELGISLFPISYDRQQHEATIRDFLGQARDIELNRGKRPAIFEIYRYLESLAMTMKCAKWSDEHEWRIRIILPGESRFAKFSDDKGRCYFELPIVAPLTLRELSSGNAVSMESTT
ncbi:MAG: DUF2971 domain-containing protein [Acidobacteriia bacterium]|nr:DUF2971 domain-containing protein [Terriglobia bacterium]